MLVNGCDCSITIKTTHCEMDIPYSEETIREAFYLLQEEANIEGNGTCKAIGKSCGVTGCVVTPLTIGTVPLLLFLAMGSAGLPVFVSETRNLYKHQLNLSPMEDTESFSFIQYRGSSNNEQLSINNGRRLFEGCRVKAFELRILRDEAIKLKLDIYGERAAAAYPYLDEFESSKGERFSGDFVSYRINSTEQTNIYGVTLSVTKEGGTKSELWIKRVLNSGDDLPNVIDELTITAVLLRDKYEYRHYGTFRITLKRLMLSSDETIIDSVDAVMGPLRYYVAGTVTAEIFTTGEGELA